MVNIYHLNRPLNLSTSTAKSRQTWVQKCALSEVNEYFERRGKNKFTGARYYRQPTGKKCFRLLFFCTVVVFVSSTFINGLAYSEEKDQSISSSLRFKIIGDQEAPAVRYFVPWKSPERDEMLPVPIPDLQPLNILDPHELRREIDYYSTLHTPGSGSKNESTEMGESPEPKPTEHK